VAGSAALDVWGHCKLKNSPKWFEDVSFSLGVQHTTISHSLSMSHDVALQHFFNYQKYKIKPEPVDTLQIDGKTYYLFLNQVDSMEVKDTTTFYVPYNTIYQNKLKYFSIPLKLSGSFKLKKWGKLNLQFGPLLHFCKFQSKLLDVPKVNGLVPTPEITEKLVRGSFMVQAELEVLLSQSCSFMLGTNLNSPLSNSGFKLPEPYSRLQVPWHWTVSAGFRISNFKSINQFWQSR